MPATVPLALALTACLSAADWPAHRGADGDAVSPETQWSTTWPDGAPKRLWSAKVGIGSAGFAVADGRAFTLGWAKDGEGSETLWCFDAASGAVRWQQATPAAGFALDHEGGSGATPTVADGRVHALSRAGRLRCHAVEDGRRLWERDLIADFAGKPPYYGYTAAPLAVGRHLIVAPGGPGASVVALDAATGAPVWKAGDNAAAYAAPVLWRVGGREALAIFDFDGFVVRHADNGAEAARLPWVTISPRRSSINAAAPVLSGDTAFISTGYGKHGGALLRLGGGGLSVAWRTTALRTMYNGAVLHDGHLYGIDADNEFTRPGESALVCLALADGSVRWKQAGVGFGAVMVAGDRLLVAGRKGQLLVVAAQAGGYRELARAQVHGGLSRSEPALSDGRLYLRNVGGDAVCLDLR